MTNGKQFLSLNERGRRRAVEALTDAEKREFFSEIVPEICDESLTIEGCRMIFEKKLSGSRYLESFDELHEMQEKGWSE